jgi:OOP family OmpA-OmpF porin
LKGVDKARLEAVGFGVEKPLAGNDTDEGREKNRRVEFNIMEQTQKKETLRPAPKTEEPKTEEKE